MGDIKECLMKMYYLYNKSSKELRSLEGLLYDLQGLVELEGYYIEDTGTALIKVCVTRQSRH